MYLFLKRMGKKIDEAINNLVLTKATGPNSGVATFMNIKALPHRAPKNVNNIQYLISILKRQKNPQVNLGVIKKSSLIATAI
jgi:hypothetical protein